MGRIQLLARRCWVAYCFSGLRSNGVHACRTEGNVSAGFDPAKHLTKVSGRDYLEVKWRVVWLRSVHPEAVIETEMIEHQIGKYAVFRAKVTLPNGAAATDFAMEEKANFEDYLEKASTKAIGRALGALGFGTQFADDFDYGSDMQRVVDSPVARPTRVNTNTPARIPDARPHEPAVPAQARPQAQSASDVNYATQNQLKRMYATGKASGWTEDEMKFAMRERFGKESSKELTVTEASQLIDLFANGPVPSEGQQSLVTAG